MPLLMVNMDARDSGGIIMEIVITKSPTNASGK
jgi:hypothetical protein